MVEYSVVLFHAASHAIRAEKVLSRAGYETKMIPTPRQLSSDCGMALRFDSLFEGPVQAILEENTVPIRGIFAI
jgi:hypothetical protein